MIGFEFATATRIVFGAGKLNEINPLLDSMLGQTSPRCILVVHGESRDRADRVLEKLHDAGRPTATFAISEEPSTVIIEKGLKQAREADCGCVVGIGGGSVIDGAKAISALLTNDGALMDYLEVIGSGKPLTRPAAPYMAVPTTAGTGAEVTRNAVIASPEHRVKVSLRSPLMLPRLALIDPELTYDLPPAVTASTGMDALTQLIEPYLCRRSNPMTDAVCREGIPRAARSLPQAYHHGHDPGARENMSIASLFGGLALANSGLGAAHGFAGPIGGMFPAPHGAVCAALLPHVMTVNLSAIQTREPNSPVLQRFDEVARLVMRSEHALAAHGIEWLHGLASDLQIPRLSSYGMTAGDIPELVEKGARASSMKANPIELERNELTEILEQAL